MRVKKSNKVSYIRKPLARHSFAALFLAAAGVIFTLVGIWLAVRSRGEAGVNAAACGFSSVLVGLVGLFYCWRSFAEREKNYILARIALAADGIVLLFWVCMIVAGLL
ncbi:calcium:proton exchanger [Clostridium sp. AM58-1XD]|uniref:calcium:proton exchanger n=1 Tax=Clostridium sp. AM58-1XD TaxID=2292307 RepID=UPI000E49D885|nr:calcium:proton exchanger [Clostridium sp. AM58-1XD]RGY99629.1 calcium:proton exchanger [Clostridium sp. AM58-1XD]